MKKPSESFAVFSSLSLEAVGALYGYRLENHDKF
jgi:hypothetical protein